MNRTAAEKQKNCLIVLAAGQGKRMGKTIPKMLIPLMGRPLLYWTLKNLDRCASVHSILLTVPPEYRKTFEKKLPGWGLKKSVEVIEGGKERIDSTLKALSRLPPDCEYVGIHDAARPFVHPALIEKCFEAAKKTGAALLAVPSKDTIKVVREGTWIERTVPRDRCWAAQTPQVFRRKLIEKMAASKKNSPKSIPTDDSSIAESLGIKVRAVLSSYENIKITTPEDLETAETILKKMKRGIR